MSVAFIHFAATFFFMSGSILGFLGSVQSTDGFILMKTKCPGGALPMLLACWPFASKNTKAHTHTHRHCRRGFFSRPKEISYSKFCFAPKEWFLEKALSGIDSYSSEVGPPNKTTGENLQKILNFGLCIHRVLSLTSSFFWGGGGREKFNQTSSIQCWLINVLGGGFIKGVEKVHKAGQ